MKALRNMVFVMLCLICISAPANGQRLFGPDRDEYLYTGGGMSTVFGDEWGALTFNATLGYRNYEKCSLVSFLWGAEVNTIFGQALGLFAVPEAGVALGPRGFKLIARAGIPLGIIMDDDFHLGLRAGAGLDFGNTLTTDFCCEKYAGIVACHVRLLIRWKVNWWE